MDNSHTLPDGTTVTTKTMTTIARDSIGRTHNENRYYLRPSDNGEGRIRDITIFDPVANTRTTLNPATQVATVVQLPARGPTTARQELDREDLGFSTVEGLSVHGFRRTRTVPEGADGNDRAITITDEYWHSNELHMNVAVKHSDPRHGVQSVTLTQIKREEPDEKMFEIPAGYTVQNENDPHAPIRLGAAAAAANLIEQVEPVYPPLAQAARVQGSVEFNAVIGEDGAIKTLQLVRGHPLLVNAAKSAILQWKYRPTILNGNAVSVIAPVVVNFGVSEQNR